MPDPIDLFQHLRSASLPMTVSRDTRTCTNCERQYTVYDGGAVCPRCGFDPETNQVVTNKLVAKLPDPQPRTEHLRVLDQMIDFPAPAARYVPPTPAMLLLQEVVKDKRPVALIDFEGAPRMSCLIALRIAAKRLDMKLIVKNSDDPNRVYVKVTRPVGY